MINDGFKNLRPKFSSFNNLQSQNSDSLLKNLCRFDLHSTWFNSSRFRGVHKGSGPSYSNAFEKDRFDDDLIRKVESPDVRIIKEKLVSLRNSRVLFIPLNSLLYKTPGSYTMEQHSCRGQYGQAISIIKRAHCFPALHHNRGPGNHAHGNPALLKDVEKPVTEYLILYRIKFYIHE